MGLPHGGNGGLEAQLLSVQGDGEGARAGDIDFAVGAHDVDEFAEFFWVAGDLDGESFDAGIDHASAEDFGILEDGGTAFLRRANAQQDEFADHRGAFGEVVGLQHVDELVHLFDDLGALEGIDVDHDGPAGGLRGRGAGGRWASRLPRSWSASIPSSAIPAAPVSLNPAEMTIPPGIPISTASRKIAGTVA